MQGTTENKVNVREIVTAYLREHGYDGLCNGDCGCILGDGFIPCSDAIDTCEPGHRVPCASDNSIWGDGWRVVPGKRPESKEIDHARGE